MFDITFEQAEKLELGLGALATFAKALGDLENSTGPNCQRKGLAVLAGTLAHARRNYSHLIKGYWELDASLCGWAGRSLVELRIWSRYNWASDSNRERFYADRLIDEYEVQAAYLELLRSAPDGPEFDLKIGSAEAELRRIERERSISSLGLEAKRLRVKTISKEVGLDRFYRFWFGILSKLSHPTSALLIEIEGGREEVDADTLRPVFLVGTQSAIEIFETAIDGFQIRGSVERWAKIHEASSSAA